MPTDSSTQRALKIEMRVKPGQCYLFAREHLLWQLGSSHGRAYKFHATSQARPCTLNKAEATETTQCVQLLKIMAITTSQTASCFLNYKSIKERGHRLNLVSILKHFSLSSFLLTQETGED